jgi:hypothetical protein
MNAANPDRRIFESADECEGSAPERTWWKMTRIETVTEGRE